LSLDDLVVMLFDEVEYVWPKLGYPPLVTPFSQYVKNVALMNVMSLLKGEERWTQIDRFTWDMILGKSGKLPGPLAPEIIELARQKGYEFTEADPQSYYPDQLDEYRKEMDENGWEYGPDDEELFELAMHDRQYRDYKSGVAKERFLADLQRAKDAALTKTGLDEDAIRRMKRAKAQPVTAPERGQVVWEVAVDGASQAPAPGRIYKQGETFCVIAAPWGSFEPVVAPFDGIIVEVDVKQGEQVQRGAALAYLERT
jgi:pyruvate carboxylase subunit B